MAAGAVQLSEREKDVLRLIAAGHTAKSAAAELELSVHTVNDYLREARKKLGVGSSREAARAFAAQDTPPPDKLAHEQIGMAASGAAAQLPGTAKGTGRMARYLPWLAGAAIMITAIIALALAAGSPTTPPPSAAKAPAGQTPAADQKADAAARQWVALIDQGQWQQSWKAAGTLFQTGVTAANWERQAGQVRTPLGMVTSRTLKSVTTPPPLPGAPAGNYRLVQFNTDFATAKGATETVVMVNQAGSWKTVGYFIK